MRSGFRAAVVVLAVVGVAPWAASPARAGDGLQVEPGEWEFTSRANMPVGPAHPAQTRRECIAEAEITPDRFKDPNSGNCTFTDVKTSKSEMSWTMHCPSPDGKLTGKGRVTSTGKTLSGKIVMTVAVETQTMQMNVDWQGKYLGPCK